MNQDWLDMSPLDREGFGGIEVDRDNWPYNFLVWR